MSQNPLNRLSVEEELRVYREALAEAFELLQQARPAAHMTTDPGRRRTWGLRKRRFVDRLIEWGVHQ